MDDHDLDSVAKKIHEAHDAEDTLMDTMPNAIHPDEDDYPGMAPPSASTEEGIENEAEQPGPDDDDRT